MTDPRRALVIPELQSGELTPRSAGHAIAALLPENAIIADESTTSGGTAYHLTANAPQHDLIAVTGGAIGGGHGGGRAYPTGRSSGRLQLRAVLDRHLPV